MFVQTWRDHFGLTEDPFSCEDADKDVVLGDVDPAAVHSGFDRLFGDPRSPAPGIVFGEKGSGKSGLRLMMRRRLDAHDEEHPDARVLVCEYIDFDFFIDEFAARIGAGRSSDKAARKVVESWRIGDHLDAILSLATTDLVDRVLDSELRPRQLSDKQAKELKLFTAVYYRSRRRGASEALRQLSSKLSLASMRPFFQWLGRLALTALGLFVILLPHLSTEVREMDAARWFYGAGVLVIAATWLWAWWDRLRVNRMAKRAARDVRVLPGSLAPIARVLADLDPRARRTAGLPGAENGTRYDLLGRFLSLAQAFGYSGLYVLFDRVDEPSLLSQDPDAMRKFVERLLDIKLLQYPGVGLKLFLPIELESIHRSASIEDMKRMRLDKSNLVSELRWTGQELFEIANQRLRARLAPNARARSVADLCAEDFDQHHLKETLTTLGTPRYAFGFLSELVLQHARELPEELPDDDPRWRIPRPLFDVVRAGWLDRANVMRRSLN